MIDPGEHAGWTTVLQAVLVAISTWYLRRGGKKDKEEVKRTTVAVTQAQTDNIGERMEAVENGLSEVRTDVGLLKHMVIRDAAGRVEPLTMEKKKDGRK